MGRLAIVKSLTDNRSTGRSRIGRSIRYSLREAMALLPALRWRVEQSAANVDDVPSRIPKRRAYLVKTAALRKWLVFDCPCGSGHRIMLNLDKSRVPYWRLTLSATHRITLSPSIDYQDNSRRCHYSIRKGRVIWAKRPRSLRLKG